MWFTYAILASLFFVGSETIQRYLLKGNKDFWAYSFWFSAFGALINLPFMLSDFEAPSEISFWLLVAWLGPLITLHNFLNFSSVKYLSPSFKSAISKFRLIWTFIFGVMFLSEIVTLGKITGAGLTVMAGLLVIGTIRGTENSKGILPIFSSTILYAIGTTIVSTLLKDSNPATITFFVFFLPATMNFILMPNAFSRTLKIIKQYRYLLILSTVTAAFGNLLMNYALKSGAQSDVVIIMEGSLVLLLAAEFFILKEKGSIRLKIAAIILAILGALLVRLG